MVILVIKVTKIMLIQRLVLPRIESRLFGGKAIIVYGARRVGKTTLIRQILNLEIICQTDH